MLALVSQQQDSVAAQLQLSNLDAMGGGGHWRTRQIPALLGAVAVLNPSLRLYACAKITSYIKLSFPHATSCCMPFLLTRRSCDAG